MKQRWEKAIVLITLLVTQTIFADSTQLVTSGQPKGSTAVPSGIFIVDSGFQNFHQGGGATYQTNTFNYHFFGNPNRICPSGFTPYVQVSPSKSVLPPQQFGSPNPPYISSGNPANPSGNGYSSAAFAICVNWVYPDNTAPGGTSYNMEITSSMLYDQSFNWGGNTGFYWTIYCYPPNVSVPTYTDSSCLGAPIVNQSGAQIAINNIDNKEVLTWDAGSGYMTLNAQSGFNGDISNIYTSRTCPTGYTPFPVVNIVAEGVGTASSSISSFSACTQAIVNSGSGYRIQEYLTTYWSSGQPSTQSTIKYNWTLLCYPPSVSLPPLICP